MITIVQGNLLEADTVALVNTVNCVGCMGKGIALQFKKVFPANFKAYQRACRAEQVQPGSMFVFATGSMLNPRFIINFPTKQHWRGKSRIEDIQSGLVDLACKIGELGISSVAIPPLGCGLGGLDWKVVRDLIEKTFADHTGVEVLLYAPTGLAANGLGRNSSGGNSPGGDSPGRNTVPQDRVRSDRAKPTRLTPGPTHLPQMTVARALLLRLMHQYSGMAYRLALLEVQKLAYFLQEAGQPLRLRYEAGRYGPYAPKLNRVLDALEGHLIQGYGSSQGPDAEIGLAPGAAETAADYLVHHPQSTRYLDRVSELIDGFETPYGMELLSSIHWVAVHQQPRATTAVEAQCAVHDWTPRKSAILDLRVAWDRLRDLDWLPTARW